MLKVFFCSALLLGSVSLFADPLRVVYASAWKPISSGESGSVTGLLPSLVDSILHKEMGMEVQHIGVPWKRAQEMIRSGKADAFITTPTDMRLRFAETTEEPFYTLEFRAFARKNSEIFTLLSTQKLTQLNGRVRFCDVLGNGWAKSFYGKKNLEYFLAPEIGHCIRMIDRERQDALIHATPVMLSKIAELDLKYVIAPLPEVYNQVKFTLLVSKQYPHSGQLVSSVDTTLRRLKREGKYQSLIIDLMSY